MVEIRSDTPMYCTSGSETTFVPHDGTMVKSHPKRRRRVYWVKETLSKHLETETLYPSIRLASDRRWNRRGVSFVIKDEGYDGKGQPESVFRRREK